MNDHTCDCENYRRATHALDEAHGMLKDARAENESLRFDLDQALKANDMSIEDCMKLRAEHDALVERLRGLERWFIATAYEDKVPQPFPIPRQNGEWIRAADLERVLGDG